MILYGIPNCNTVKKARDWLSAQGHAVPFHDFKKQGVTEALLREWLQQQPWEKLVNRAGTTWRQLTDEAKAAIAGPEQAITLMLEKPSVIKRPVLVKDGRVTLGFDPDTYASLFA